MSHDDARCWSSTDDAVRRVPARGECRRGQPQDGRGGRCVGGGRFTNVKTILASGNVLLESRSGVDAVRKKAEKALRDEFGYDAWVLAYDLDTVRAISDAFPVRARSRRAPQLRHVRHRRRRARRTRGAGQGRRSRREDQARQGRHLLAGPQQGHAGHHDRQDDGQEALQVVDDHPQPAHARQGAAIGYIRER